MAQWLARDALPSVCSNLIFWFEFDWHSSFSQGQFPTTQQARYLGQCQDHGLGHYFLEQHVRWPRFVPRPVPSQSGSGRLSLRRDAYVWEVSLSFILKFSLIEIVCSANIGGWESSRSPVSFSRARRKEYIAYHSVWQWTITTQGISHPRLSSRSGWGHKGGRLPSENLVEAFWRG